MANRLEELIGVAFQDGRLIESAFVHRSFMHEHPERIPQLSSNERLEFLGDAVLNFLTASWLYARYPDRSEGELTALRAALVRTTTLADFARELNLGPYIRISRGDDTPIARNRAPLLADVFEAVLGAIFLDQGLDAARAFIIPFLERRIEAVIDGSVGVDYRTRLQEQAQAQFGHTPRYYLIAMSGPDHEREFTMEVSVGDQIVGVGSGSNKQAAAQAAAQAALDRLGSAEEPQL
jgi:ribonuclease III